MTRWTSTPGAFLLRQSPLQVFLRPLPLSVLVALFLVQPQTLRAQEVWRCGPDGRSYSSQPCAEGRRIEVPAARPAEEVREARRVAFTEVQRAETVRQERLAEEAALRGTGLTGIGPTEELKPRVKRSARDRPAPRRKPARRDLADGGTWPAAVPGSRRKSD